MAARIYSLAKELKLDSKVLVDICPKAGVHGKGSALASLSQDEEDRLRAYLTKATTRNSPAATAVAQPAPAREQRTVKTLTSGLKRPKLGDAGLEPALETAEATDADEASFEQPAEFEPGPVVSKSSPAVAEDTAPATSQVEQHARLEPSRGSENGDVPPEPQSPAQRRPLSPNNQGQLRNLAKGRRRDGDNKGRPGESPKPDGGGPTIRVAAMPAVKEPPKKPQKNEPAPQKPDIKLPADAIRSVKSGSGALQERVRKQLEEKQRKKEAKKRGEVVVEETESAVARRRRGGGRETPAPPGDAGTVSRDERTNKRRRGRGGTRRAEDGDGGSDRRQKTWQRTGRDTSKPRKGNVVVQLPCTIRSFSEALGTPAAGVLFTLRDITGVLSNINAGLDLETAQLLAGELGYEVEFKHPVDLERQLLDQFANPPQDPARLRPRAPVVTFLGHVDHGKTSLLDRIIGLNVVAGEAGGITQHIRAYTIEKDGKQIAFVDTPGHEAFTEMRARGANVTDIAVLVVAADDGVMPQTEEAISHARAAQVPIVVALNKIDLPGVDENRIMQQLAANELLPSEWGGDVEVVRCSALKGTGLDTLLETILTVAELHEYQADPESPASGTCLEAERHEGRGVVAKVIVQNGTLKVGDIVVCGTAYGRVKAMYDTLRPEVRHETAPPSTAVNLTGLDEVPKAGERFYVASDIVKAREIAGTRGQSSRASELSGAVKHVSLENLLSRLEEGKSFLPGDEVQTLNVIVRADTRGSIEAIEKEFTKLHHAEVQIRILQKLVGGVTEADVHLADASDAIILAFNVVPDEKARTLAQQRGVEIRRYDIIYRVTEDIKAALEGMLKPNKEEVELGAALVKRVFTISRLGSIAGCHVMRGTITRVGQVRMRVIRNNTIIGDYPLDSLRREKDDAKEVRQGLECGIKLQGFNDVKEGDVLEAYKIQEVARTL